MSYYVYPHYCGRSRCLFVSMQICAVLMNDSFGSYILYPGRTRLHVRLFTGQLTNRIILLVARQQLQSTRSLDCCGGGKERKILHRLFKFLIASATPVNIVFRPPGILLCYAVRKTLSGKHNSAALVISKSITGDNKLIRIYFRVVSSSCYILLDLRRLGEDMG